MTEDPWYAERRARWKPEHVRLLIVAESAPDDGGDPARRRFFYDDALTGRDGLFREVVRVMFDDPPLVSGPHAKVPWLEQLRARGVYLLDLAPVPVNYASPQVRREVLGRRVRALVEEAVSLNPRGVVLVKKNVFELLYDPMRVAGLNVLQSQAIPFPASGQQARFRAGLDGALRHLAET